MDARNRGISSHEICDNAECKGDIVGVPPFLFSHNRMSKAELRLSVTNPTGWVHSIMGDLFGTIIGGRFKQHMHSKGGQSNSSSTKAHIA